jgi:hypothetical protein
MPSSSVAVVACCGRVDVHMSTCSHGWEPHHHPPSVTAVLPKHYWGDSMHCCGGVLITGCSVVGWLEALQGQVLHLLHPIMGLGWQRVCCKVQEAQLRVPIHGAQSS